MAGDWIPFDHDLPEKEEVIAICAKTGASVADVILRLCRLWIWFDRHTIDGTMKRIGNAGVTLKCGGDDAFWKAVCDVGWLKITGGMVIIPGFAQRFGSSARRRLLTAKRVTLHRLAKQCNADCVTGSVTKTLQDALPTTTTTTTRKEQPPNPLLPSDLDSPEFRAAWEDWLKHRRQKHKPATPTSQTRAIAKLRRMGRQRAIAALDHSIANGWDGIFEPDERKGVSQQRIGPGQMHPDDLARASQEGVF